MTPVVTTALASSQIIIDSMGSVASLFTILRMESRSTDVGALFLSPSSPQAQYSIGLCRSRASKEWQASGSEDSRHRRMVSSISTSKACILCRYASPRSVCTVAHEGISRTKSVAGMNVKTNSENEPLITAYAGRMNGSRFHRRIWRCDFSPIRTPTSRSLPSTFRVEEGFQLVHTSGHPLCPLLR